MKRIICLLLALLMVISVFASCGKTEEPVDTDAEQTTEGSKVTEPDVTTEEATTEEATTEEATTEEATTEEVTTEEATTEEVTTEEATTEEVTTDPEITTHPEDNNDPVVMKDYNLSDFKIVYGGDHNLELAESLRDDIKAKTGVELQVVKGTTAQSSCEFIIGSTSRDVSKYCFDYKNNEYMDSYGVLCDNGKVQLLGADKRTLNDSIDYLVDKILTAETTVSLAEEGALCEKIKLSSEKINEKANASQLRVVTNNILQEYIAQNTYKLPETQNRISQLIAFYALIDADIIGFQEVDSGWYNKYNLKGEMEALGYTLAGNYTNIGCPIYYKTDRFNLLEKGYATYDTTMFADGPYEARTYSWVVLEEKATGNKVAVANTHFVWGWGSVNGSSETAYNYRNESARQLVAWAESMETKYPTASSIVMGDLNSYLDSDVCDILGESMNFARETAETKKNSNYDSDMSKPGVKPSRSTSPKVIDHIYYTDTNLTAKQYEVCISPYAYVFTDHVPVITDFAFN